MRIRIFINFIAISEGETRHLFFYFGLSPFTSRCIFTTGKLPNVERVFHERGGKVDFLGGEIGSKSFPRYNLIALGISSKK